MPVHRTDQRFRRDYANVLQENKLQRFLIQCAEFSRAHRVHGLLNDHRRWQGRRRTGRVGTM